MLKRILIILIVVLGSVAKMVAQDSIPEKKIERTIEKADERYREYSFSPAIDRDRSEALAEQPRRLPGDRHAGRQLAP